MKKMFYEKMEQNPVIAAVKNIGSFDIAINSPCEIVFLMCGNILNLKDLVKQAHEKGKLVFIHIDLIEGFSRDAVALEYIASEIRPDGIISTKNSQIKIAKELNLLTVQRIFIIDSMSIETAIKSSALLCPDAVEIMPGIMPTIIELLSDEANVPVIAGGLIKTKDDIINAINAGASGVSMTSPSLWDV